MSTHLISHSQPYLQWVTKNDGKKEKREGEKEWRKKREKGEMEKNKERKGKKERKFYCID